MPSLTDSPELIGFFSYSREDDEDSENALSALRTRIQNELRAQLGRSKETLRLFQDREAIPPGTLWEAQIDTAIKQAIFFIPIITPRVLRSEYCGMEFQKFLDRERELLRQDLVFPILYIDVEELENEKIWRQHPVLKTIGERQYVDWREFRYDPNSPEIRKAIALFCRTIGTALKRPSSSARPEPHPEQREETRLVSTRPKEGLGGDRVRAYVHTEREISNERAEEPERKNVAQEGEQEKPKSQAESDAEVKNGNADTVHLLGFPLRSGFIATLVFLHAAFLEFGVLKSAPQRAPLGAEWLLVLLPVTLMPALGLVLLFLPPWRRIVALVAGILGLLSHMFLLSIILENADNFDPSSQKFVLDLSVFSGLFVFAIMIYWASRVPVFLGSSNPGGTQVDRPG